MKSQALSEEEKKVQRQLEEQAIKELLQFSAKEPEDENNNHAAVELNLHELDDLAFLDTIVKQKATPVKVSMDEQQKAIHDLLMVNLEEDAMKVGVFFYSIDLLELK